MKKIILTLSLLFVIFFAGCSANQNQIEEAKLNFNNCETPFISNENGCCLDQNENKICDSIDEEKAYQEKIQNMIVDMTVVQVYAKDTSDYRIDANKDEINIVFRLGSGSPSIDLNYLELESNYDGESQKIKWSGSENFSSSNFGLKYISPPNTNSNIFNYGNLGIIMYKPSKTITNVEKLQIRLNYGKGSIPLSFYGGKIQNKETTYLYP